MNYIFINDTPYEINFEDDRLNDYRIKKSGVDITDSVKNEIVDIMVITLIQLTLNISCNETHVDLWTDDYTNRIKEDYPHLGGLLTDYDFIKLVIAMDYNTANLNELDTDAKLIQENPDYMGSYFSIAYHQNKLKEFISLYHEYYNSDMTNITLYERINNLLK